MSTPPKPTNSVLRLRLLGDPALERAARTVPLERKTAGLLALLALNGPTPRGRAAALLWPELDAAAARNNLRQRLHHLRKRAGCEVALGEGDVLRLADGVEHDVGMVAQALAQDAGAAAGELLGALEFADCEPFEAWLREARLRWRGTRRGVLARLSSALEAQGHLALALSYAERLVAEEPLLEHAHRRRMRLHYLRGDRAAALAAYQRCREVLEHELGASPAGETTELLRLIEASAVLPVAAAPPRVAPVLRPPRLVGRDREWQQLSAACSERRLGIVSGEPGVGKSRLLEEYAARNEGFVRVGARPGDASVPCIVLARLLRAVWERFSPQPEAWVRHELAHWLPELMQGEAGSRPEPSAAAAPALGPWPLLQQAAGAALRAATGLAGCIVEDLHNADEASVEALLAIAGSEEGRALCWLASMRPGDRAAPLAVRLELAGPGDVLVIGLAPLDTAAVQALLASLALPGLDARAWAEPLTRHTGGNPLFVLETVKLLLAERRPTADCTLLELPAPATVEQLIERRLARLSPEALRLARLAALAGPAFTPGLAARVLHQHPLDLAGAWRELEAAQILREGAFVHNLVLETTLRSVPEAIALLMRREMA